MLLSIAHDAIKSDAVPRTDDIARANREQPTYHRRADATELAKVQQSGELHGKAPGNTYQSSLPAVKAFMGPLPAGMSGYEFVTPAVPSSGSPGVNRGTGQVNWHADSPGARQVDDETVAIPVTVTRVVP